MRDAARDTYSAIYNEVLTRDPLISLLQAQPLGSLSPARHQVPSNAPRASDPWKSDAPEPAEGLALVLSVSPQSVPTAYDPEGRAPEPPPSRSSDFPSAISNAPILPAWGLRSRWTVHALIAGLLLTFVVGAVLAFQRPSRPTAATDAAAATLPLVPTTWTPTAVPLPAVEPTAPPPPAEARVAPRAVEAPAAHRAATQPVPIMPIARTASSTKPAPAVPCKLIETLDKSGETHFSCPCSRCQ
jgi:hypothetical protein